MIPDHFNVDAPSHAVPLRTPIETPYVANVDVPVPVQFPN